MTNEHDLETSVRGVLQTVSKLTPVAPDLAERLIANASSGRQAVVPLRLARRFTFPLLAAAACIVVIVAVVLGGKFAADRSVNPPAVIQPTPTVAPPTGGPSSAATSAPSSSGPSASRASTSNGATGPGSTTIGSSKTSRQANSPVTVLPPSTGAPDSFRAVALDFLDARRGGRSVTRSASPGRNPAARR